MIFLIVNADDLGINTERDRGIIKAFKDGIVTSSTMIANGLSFETAATQVKETDLPVGVHLNISEGTTLSGPILGLTDQDHRLPGKVIMRQYLLGNNVDMPAIRRELAAQVEKILMADLKPRHLDGHQHCHAYPILSGVVIDLAKEFDINAIRSTNPAECKGTVVPDDLTEDMDLFGRIGLSSQKACQDSGIKTTQGLWGLPLLNNLNTETLCDLLEIMPNGHWELMTHPGYPCPEGRHFESTQRLTELKALCSREAKEMIQQRAITLGTFGDLPCAF